MRTSSDSSTGQPRRRFIAEVATGAALLATGCAPAVRAPGPGAQASAPGGPGGRPWDTTWVDRIRGRHRAVFDVTTIDHGLSLYQTAGYLRHVVELLGATERDISVVVVLRHDATPMLLTDELWSRYGLGEETGTRETRTSAVATRNIFYQAADTEGVPISDARPTATIRSLMSRGVMFIGCDQALRGFSYPLARKTSVPADSVYTQLRDGLVPGAILMPTGIFATLTAQAAGCGLLSSS